MFSLDGKENGGAFTKRVTINMTCVNNYQDTIFDLEDSMHEQDEQVNQVKKSRVKNMECTFQRDKMHRVINIYKKYSKLVILQ